jgi:aldehyde dehydrogenase (NAD+)
VDFINDMPKPLALYVFTNNKDSVQKITEETSSGGLLTNDCLLQVSECLPLRAFGI